MARSMGLDTLRQLVVERALTDMPPDDVREALAAQADKVERLLTEPVSRPSLGIVAQETVLSYSGTDRYACWEAMNEDFLGRKWADGFPLIAPTPDLVDAMLKGTRRKRDEVVVLFEPVKGIATVEKVAVNAAMAGCKPEHLPILLAAIEAVHQPNAYTVNQFTSTSAVHPFILVNGPIVKELDICYGRGSLGPGYQSRVNTAIGRAMRLCMINLGHLNIGEGDMDTIGSPTKFGMVAGENEDDSPWEPYHVEHGFAKEDNAVSVFGCDGLIPIMDMKNQEPEAILMMFAHSINAIGAGATYYWLRGSDWNHTLLMAPEQARNVARGGFSKYAVKQYLFNNALLPWGVIKNAIPEEWVEPGWKWLYGKPDDYMVRIAREPEQFDVVVIGGPVGKSQAMPLFGKSVTVGVRP